MSRKLLINTIFMFTAVVLLLSACGDASIYSGSGGSGIGGTGISVSGKVVAVDGNTTSYEDDSENKKFRYRVIDGLVQHAYAFQKSIIGILVNAGGQHTLTSNDGSFLLENVNPSENLVILFTVDLNTQASLSIGKVDEFTAVEITGIKINTITKTVSYESLSKRPIYSEQNSSSENTSSNDSSSNGNSSNENTEDETNNTEASNSTPTSSESGAASANTPPPAPIADAAPDTQVDASDNTDDATNNDSSGNDPTANPDDSANNNFPGLSGQTVEPINAGDPPNTTPISDDGVSIQQLN